MSGGVERGTTSSQISGSLVPFALGVFAFYAWWVSPSSGAATGLLSAGNFLLFSGTALLLASVAVLIRGQIIHNPRDYFGGLALLGLALVALWASKDLPGLRGFAFGPGTAPRMFAMTLGVLGVAVAVLGMLTRGPAVERFQWRGPFFITVALFTFAGTIRPLGLVIASMCSILAAAAATHEVRWLETIVWAVVLTVFCSLLFPYGLNLPLQLWPRF
jgi:putative tricarboxylic transport membrane protein